MLRVFGTEQLYLGKGSETIIRYIPLEMINQPVLDFITQQQQKGISDTDIRALLTAQGWKSEDLDKAFNHVLTPGIVEKQVISSVDTELNTDKLQSPVQNARSKAPLFVIIIAWLILLGGIFSLLGVLPLLLLGGFGQSLLIILFGIFNLVTGIGLIAVSFGIRHMRRWALYAYTALTVIALGLSLYSFITGQKRELTQFADVAIQTIILVYFWAISKKFV